LINTLKQIYPDKKFALNSFLTIQENTKTTTIKWNDSIYDLEKYHNINVENKLLELIKENL